MACWMAFDYVHVNETSTHYTMPHAEPNIGDLCRIPPLVVNVKWFKDTYDSFTVGAAIGGTIAG